MGRREKILIAVLAVLLIGGVVLRFTGVFSGMEEVPANNAEGDIIFSEDNLETADIETVDAEKKLITVHVVGSVSNPGVYHLPEDSRVDDAILKAGGFTPDADMERINLARPLIDGEQILVPEMLKNGEDIDLSTAPEETGMVNINRASVSELETLSGIGETRGRAIVQYREENGPFASIEDIMEVPNIGAGIFEGIKDQITVF